MSGYAPRDSTYWANIPQLPRCSRKERCYLTRIASALQISPPTVIRTSCFDHMNYWIDQMVLQRLSHRRATYRRRRQEAVQRLQQLSNLVLHSPPSKNSCFQSLHARALAFRESRKHRCMVDSSHILFPIGIWIDTSTRRHSGMFIVCIATFDSVLVYDAYLDPSYSLFITAKIFEPGSALYDALENPNILKVTTPKAHYTIRTCLKKLYLREHAVRLRCCYSIDMRTTGFQQLWAPIEGALYANIHTHRQSNVDAAYTWFPLMFYFFVMNGLRMRPVHFVKNQQSDLHSQLPYDTYISETSELEQWRQFRNEIWLFVLQEYASMEFGKPLFHEKDFDGSWTCFYDTFLHDLSFPQQPCLSRALYGSSVSAGLAVLATKGLRRVPFLNRCTDFLRHNVSPLSSSSFSSSSGLYMSSDSSEYSSKSNFSKHSGSTSGSSRSREHSPRSREHNHSHREHSSCQACTFSTLSSNRHLSQKFQTSSAVGREDISTNGLLADTFRSYFSRIPSLIFQAYRLWLPVVNPYRYPVVSILFSLPYTHPFISREQEDRTRIVNHYYGYFLQNDHESEPIQHLPNILKLVWKQLKIYPFELMDLACGCRWKTQWAASFTQDPTLWVSPPSFVPNGPMLHHDFVVHDLDPKAPPSQKDIQFLSHCLEPLTDHRCCQPHGKRRNPDPRNTVYTRTLKLSPSLRFEDGTPLILDLPPQFNVPTHGHRHRGRPTRCRKNRFVSHRINNVQNTLTRPKQLLGQRKTYVTGRISPACDAELYPNYT